MQIGILSFFSVTSIMSTGIFVQNKKKKKIDFCGLHDRHVIKAMYTLACVAIVCSSAEQCTQSVFAFDII